MIAVAALGVVLAPQLSTAYSHNPALNSGIFIVFLIGVVFIFWQVLRLKREITWIDRFRTGRSNRRSTDRGPRLLAPMAAMIGARKGKLQPVRALAALGAGRHQCSPRRDATTFRALLHRPDGLPRPARHLLGPAEDHRRRRRCRCRPSPSPATPTIFSTSSRPGLQAPLAGMGTAFSSSLLGLAGSLVLGYLELQASQAHNRFFNELEDWLSGMTRLHRRRAAGRLRAVDPRLHPGAAGTDRRQPGQPAAHDVRAARKAASKPIPASTRWPTARRA